MSPQVIVPAQLLWNVHGMADPRAQGGGALQAALQAKVTLASFSSTLHWVSHCARWKQCQNLNDIGTI